MATQYWVGDVVGGDNWSNVNAWAAASGGAGGTGTVPVAGDTTYFDALSLRSCTVDAAAATGVLDCTGFAQTLTLAAALAIDGATFTLAAGMTFTPATFKVSFVNSAGAVVNIASAGQSFYDIELGPVAGNNGVWTLVDALVVGNDFLFTRGTFAANNQSVTVTRDMTWAATVAANSYQAGSGTHTVGRNLSWRVANTLSAASYGTSRFVFPNDSEVTDNLVFANIAFYDLDIAPVGKSFKMNLLHPASVLGVYHQLTTGAGTVDYKAGAPTVSVQVGQAFAAGYAVDNPFNIDPGCTWKVGLVLYGSKSASHLDIRPANYDITGSYVATQHHGPADVIDTHDMRLTANVHIKASVSVVFGYYGYSDAPWTQRLLFGGFNLTTTAPNTNMGDVLVYTNYSPTLIINASTFTVNGNLTFRGTQSPYYAAFNGDTRLAVLTTGGKIVVSGNVTFTTAAGGAHAQFFDMAAGCTITCGGNWNVTAAQVFSESYSYNALLQLTSAGSPTLNVNVTDRLPILRVVIGGACTLPANLNVQQLLLVSGALTTAGTLTIRELYNGGLGTTLTVTGDFFIGSGFVNSGTVVTTGASIYTTRPLCSLDGFNPTKVIMGRNTIRLQLTSAMNIGKLVLQGQRHAPGILQFKAGSTYAVGDLDSELDMPDCPVQFISSVAGTTYTLNVAVNSSTDYIWPRDCTLGGGASPITGDITNKDLENNSGWNLPGKGIIRVITDDPGQDTMALGDPGDYQFCWLVATSKAALTTLASDFANGHHNWHRRTYLPYAELDALAIGTNYFIGLGLRNSNDDRLAPNIAAGDYIERYAESSLGGGAHSIFSNFQTPVV